MLWNSSHCHYYIQNCAGGLPNASLPLKFHLKSQNSIQVEGNYSRGQGWALYRGINFNHWQKQQGKSVTIWLILGVFIIFNLPVILNVFTSGSSTCYSPLFLKEHNFPGLIISLCKATTLDMPQFRHKRIEIPQNNLTILKVLPT